MVRPAFPAMALFVLLAAPVHAADREFSWDNAALFYEAWSDVWENYSYLAYKDVDWRAVYQEHKDTFDQDLSPDEFARALNRVLSLLHDWHVAVQTPSGQWLGFGGDYDCNYPPEPLERYLAPGQAYLSVGGGVIIHARLRGDVAYIRVDSLETGRWANLGQAYVDSMLDRYMDASGVILDIRANNGGNEDFAALMASRFADQERVYGYVRDRIPGPDPTRFGPFESKVLRPRGQRYAGPVVCLVGRRCLSSAEWFALMLRACPDAVLMGDRTRGGTGNPNQFDLANGVSFTLSSWMGFDAQKRAFEDLGLVPDILIPAEESVVPGRDLVLEQALDNIAGRVR